MARKRFLIIVGIIILCAMLVNIIGCDTPIEDGSSTGTEERSDTPLESDWDGKDDISASQSSSDTEKQNEGAAENTASETNASGNTVNDTETKETEDTANGETSGTETLENSETNTETEGYSEKNTEKVDEEIKVSEFALDLFKTAKEDGKNTLISPMSVLAALSMTTNGADGNTRRQMESVLGMSAEELNLYLRAYISGLPQGEKYKLSIANSVWFKEKTSFSVREDFLTLCTEYYGADVFKAPFDGETLKDINGWVNQKTDGMIPEVLDEIPDEAVMYLINALAFDAEWMHQYQEYAVRDGVFTKEDGTQVNVQMMRGDDGLYIEDDKSTGFVKFYNGQKYAFVGILPNEGVSVSEYVASLDGERVQSLLKGARSGLWLHTSMPKFKVDYSVEMSEILKKMGMVDAFDSARADLSLVGSSTEGNLYISRVIHKTFIEVGELGTRAGAATVIEVAEESAPEEMKQVYLDRPFVYMIIDWENKVPFFIGTMMDPGK